MSTRVMVDRLKFMSLTMNESFGRVSIGSPESEHLSPKPGLRRETLGQCHLHNNAIFTRLPVTCNRPRTRDVCPYSFEAHRLLPSASRWNSIEIDFNLVPQSGITYDSLPSSYSKSYDYNIVIRDRKLLKRCLYISASIVSLIFSSNFAATVLPHKHHHHGPSKNLTLALNQALTFFDAQKSGTYLTNSPVKISRDSGLQDGNLTSNHANLVGGFYDSGNNIKFSFSTAYTMTLLSWTVIEYHQKYADIDKFQAAVDDETSSDKWIFDWNNKLTANMVLLTRLQFFHDLGYPYEASLKASSNMTGSLMCSYVSRRVFSMTPGGLVIQRPDYGAPLQFAATASFLSKLYGDYLDLLREVLVAVAALGTSFRAKYTIEVHQSLGMVNITRVKMDIKWRDSKDPNPNVLLGAMVGGPDQFDKFIDERDKQDFTEPRLTSNAGLVAALIALHDPPHTKKSKKRGNYDPTKLGIDQMGIFDKIH
ncbi:hypothetical protein J5N97_002042 [Dioscorea zingiberensis]|uniref:cellulase n=1 Tax=Dioscorea zingiberensis TaxID=325984 RepID=A0A9D5BT92_9LILI|nr:hypothetical protein J5N97_002042 [Dioscorea zingiberensis]